VLRSAVTISASGANAGYVNYYQSDIWASDCSYLSETENERLRYLYLLLNHRQADVSAMQKGSAQPHVYPKDIERLEVFRAPADLIAWFSTSIDPIFDQIAVLGRQAEQLAKARDLLLPRLMSGSLAV
jgi:type I restriction enzyme S subunit